MANKIRRLDFVNLFYFASWTVVKLRNVCLSWFSFDAR